MGQKNEKPIKPVNEKNFMLFSGLCLCIFAFILIMDVGYVARTLTFIPNFLFGFGTYLFLLLLIIKGISLVFANRRIKFKHMAWIISGIVVMMVGISSLISLTSYKTIYYIDNFSSIYASHFANYYSEIKLPFLFQSGNQSIGGGYIGYFLSASLNSIFNNTFPSYLISSFVIVIGLIVGAFPFIVDALQRKFNKNKKQKAIIKQQIEDYGAANPNFVFEIKDKSSDAIKSAGLRNEPVFNEPEKVKEPASNQFETQRTNIAMSSSIYPSMIVQKPGGLTKAVYKKEVGPDFAPPHVDTVSQNKEVPSSLQNNDFTMVNQTPVNKTTPAIEPKKEIKPEQIQLDFSEDAVAKKDDLVAISPEFSDPVVVKKQNVSSQSIKIDNTPKEIIENKPIKITHKFIPPDISLLNEYENSAATEKNTQTAIQRMEVINGIFKTFSVKAQCCGYVIGPSVTRYNIEYFETAMFKTVNNLTNDISIRLGGVSSRFESIVPGQTYSGLEVPNAMVTTVGFKEILEKLPPREKNPMAVAFGKNISGEVVWTDLYKMPHMLIAGTTGSGKSIFVHSIIMTLIMRNNPDDLRLVLIDPKRVEMSKYKEMPHLLCPNIVEPEEALVCMNKLVDEMERRYSLLEEKCVSDIQQYNELCDEDPTLDKMPYYVAILDEYSDLVDRVKDIQRPIISLAQKARSAGIHLIICTQRPSTNVITGLIKGNLPTHVALMTASSVDSITIIGEGGAEKLLGKGDMLVQSATVSKVGCVRLQGCFVQNSEILKVVEFLKSTMTTDYHPDFLDLKDHSKDVQTPFAGFNPDEARGEHVDEKYEDVKEMVMSQEYASISKIQREFGFGFTRAGRIFARLQSEGIVEAKGTAKGCKVLIHDSGYDIEGGVGSDEVSSVESLNEYVENSNNKDGGY